MKCRILIFTSLLKPFSTVAPLYSSIPWVLFPINSRSNNLSSRRKQVDSRFFDGNVCGQKPERAKFLQSHLHQSVDFSADCLLNKILFAAPYSLVYCSLKYQFCAANAEPSLRQRFSFMVNAFYASSDFLKDITQLSIFPCNNANSKSGLLWCNSNTHKRCKDSKRNIKVIMQKWMQKTSKLFQSKFMQIFQNIEGY